MTKDNNNKKTGNKTKKSQIKTKLPTIFTIEGKKFTQEDLNLYKHIKLEHIFNDANTFGTIKSLVQEQIDLIKVLLG